MEQVQRFTKPALVDFLRICDRERWCSPRIRYASIRSKPDLCKDLIKFFDFRAEEQHIRILPKRAILNFPDLRYHVKQRQYYRDGKQFDCARVSREKPQFSFVRHPVTLEFGTIRGVRGSGTSVAVAAMFP